MFDFAESYAPPVDPATAWSGHGALQQSDAWLNAVRALGSDARVQQIGETPCLVLRKSLPLVRDVALISRAGLALSAGRAATLRTMLGTRHLIVNAETVDDAISLARAGFRRVAAPRMIAELRLAPTTEEMTNRLAPKWRNRLRHAESKGLKIRCTPMPADPNHWLLRAEARQSLRLGYRPLPPDMVAALAASAPGAAMLFSAYHLGQRVGGMLFFRHGRTATYQIGWMEDEGRERSAGTALMWRAMTALRNSGVEVIDLGAADPDHAPGLARFKRGTGAELRTLGGTWLDSAWVPRTSKAARSRNVAHLRGVRHGHLLASARSPWSES
jgi:hypothetical protein